MPMLVLADLLPPIRLALAPLSLTDRLMVSLVVAVAVVVYFRLFSVALTSAKLPVMVTLPLLFDPMLAPPLAVKFRLPCRSLIVAVMLELL